MVWSLVYGLGLTLLLSAALWFTVANGQQFASGDSPTYLSSAENMAAGRGYIVSFGGSEGEAAVHAFPPGYPATVAALTSFGIEVETAAAIISSLLVGAIAGSFFAFTLRRVGSPGVAIAVGALAALLTFPFAVAPRSEALFGLLISVAVMSAASFLRSRNEKFLLFASLMAVLSVTVRTVGLAVVAGIAVTAWLGLEDRRRRLIYSGGIVLAGLLVFRALVGTGERAIAWHPPDLQTLKVGAHAIVRWLVPDIANPLTELVLFLGLVVGIGVLLTAAYRRTGLDISRSAPWWPAALVAVFQVLMLLAARALFVAQTDLSSRLMYPVALAVLLGAVELTSSKKSSAPSRSGRVAVLLLCGAALAASSWIAIQLALDVRSGDRDIASSEFIDGAPVDAARELSSDHILYSNYPDALWVADIDRARYIPRDYSPLSLLPNESLEAELDRLGRETLANDAVVLMYRAQTRGYQIDEETVREVVPCVVVETEDAVLLVSNGHPWCP